MKAKDKAKELFLKFQGFSIDDINAKQCALIAVDEILEAIKGMVDEESGYSADGYYLEVKQEIINL